MITKCVHVHLQYTHMHTPTQTKQSKYAVLCVNKFVKWNIILMPAIESKEMKEQCGTAGEKKVSLLSSMPFRRRSTGALPLPSEMSFERAEEKKNKVNFGECLSRFNVIYVIQMPTTHPKQQ